MKRKIKTGHENLPETQKLLDDGWVPFAVVAVKPEDDPSNLGNLIYFYKKDGFPKMLGKRRAEKAPREFEDTRPRNRNGQFIHQDD